jgi:uncharacterized membrane protein YeaQ/YmgE (transglycosylase-associated protein family)
MGGPPDHSSDNRAHPFGRQYAPGDGRAPFSRPFVLPGGTGGRPLRAAVGIIEPRSGAHPGARQEVNRVPNMDILGWIVVGLLAGALSSAVVKAGGPEGCLGNTVIGILGGLLGGWFATEELHMSSTSGFLGALLVAFLGATVIRLILNALEGNDRRGHGGSRR